MRVLTLPSAGGPPSRLFVVDDRVAEVIAGQRLRVFDLAGALVFERDATDAGTCGSSIVTLAGDGAIHRIDPDGRAVEVMRVDGCDDLIVSRSGRFAVADNHEARLLDLERGVEVLRMKPDLPPSRAHFDTLPDGREVLFVASPSYMDVRAIACATGDELARHEHGPGGMDFCHVDFALAADATRLVVFGCVWAWPYDARIYDVRAWLAGGTRLPAPLIAIEPIACNTLLACDRADDAGLCTSACVEVSAELGPDEDGDLPGGLEHLRAHEPALAAQLDRAIAQDTHALIVRRIDPARAAIVASAAHPIPSVYELDVHYADGGRVVVIGERLIVADADGDLADHGALAPHRNALTRATRDAQVAIIAPP